MEKYDFDNLCLNCLGQLNSDRICLSCGEKAYDKPSPPHQLQKSSLLNKKYLIRKTLGEGGFGITYLAWDLSKKEQVAIKEYFPNGSVTRNEKTSDVNINSSRHASVDYGLKRFIDEAQILSKIKNLNGIVEVKDFFSAHNTAYIVMEFLNGISLNRYISEKGKITFENALKLLYPVIVSLKEVHAANLLHRDIAPDNILITKEGEAKLIDFGAAKRSNDNKSSSVILKHGFAPEEQYRADGIQGAWTDIYALGVTFYYCITAQLPPKSIDRLKKDQIIPPSELNATISPRQEQLLMKAIAVKTEDRFSTIAEMEDAMFSVIPDADKFFNVESKTRKVHLQTDYKNITPVIKSSKERSKNKSEIKNNAQVSIKLKDLPFIPINRKSFFQKLKDKIKGE